MRFELAGRLQPDGSRFKVPQMGWNQVRQAQPHPMWAGIADDSYFYFVHSYYARPSDARHSAGEADYGARFTAAVARDNIFATQFHPEKSADQGLRSTATSSTGIPDAHAVAASLPPRSHAPSPCC